MEDIRIETRKKLKDNPLCSCCGKEYEQQSGNFFYSDSPIMPEIKDSSGFAKNARKSFIVDMCSSLKIHIKQWNVCVRSLIYTMML